MKKIAIYPGTFDPPTFGHMDVLYSALKLFDEVLWVFGSNASKKRMFDLSNMMSAAAITVIGQHISLCADDGVIVDLAMNNAVLAPSIETILMSLPGFLPASSTAFWVQPCRASLAVRFVIKRPRRRCIAAVPRFLFEAGAG